MFKSLAGYQRSWLSGDLVSGLTVWVVLVREALAYASIAGVCRGRRSVRRAALILYAAFGSSKHLVGPLAATAALSGAAADIAARSSADVAQLTVGFGKGLAAAKMYATKEHYPIDPNRELIGLGAANLGSGLSLGMSSPDRCCRQPSATHVRAARCTPRLPPRPRETGPPSPTSRSRGRTASRPATGSSRSDGDV